MNKYRKWFALVVWIGVVGNWSFAWALFITPHQSLAVLGLGSVESTVWLFNYSVLLALLSCFYIPAARDPFRYRANTWLLIAGRLVPAATYFVGVSTGYMPPGFCRLGIGDLSVGIGEIILLGLLIRAEKRSKAPPSK